VIAGVKEKDLTFFFSLLFHSPPISSFAAVPRSHLPFLLFLFIWCLRCRCCCPQLEKIPFFSLTFLFPFGRQIFKKKKKKRKKRKQVRRFLFTFSLPNYFYPLRAMIDTCEAVSESFGPSGAESKIDYKHHH